MSREKIKECIDRYTKSPSASKIIHSSNIFNDKGFGVWSFKKLCFLEYYLMPALSIALTNIPNCKCYFIDLFSGAGANKDGERMSIGSPIISLLSGMKKNKTRDRTDRFFKWFFVEQNLESHKALKERVKTSIKIVKEKFGEDLLINKDIKILGGDCNTLVDEITKEINVDIGNGNAYVILFIDPYKFSDIKWETWRKFSQFGYVDIIFTLPVYTINRGVTRCKNAESYFPPSVMQKIREGETKISKLEFSKLYAKDLVDLFGRSIMHYD
jgi:three-Cys-motif partner protein